jgi:hypothetical protein
MPGNQQALREAVEVLIIEISLVKFSVITIQQKFILLKTYVLKEMPPLEILCRLLAAFN